MTPRYRTRSHFSHGTQPLWAIGMKTRTWFTLGLSALVIGCAAPGLDRPPQQDTKAEVAAFLDQYLSAIEARDERKIRAAYVSDDRFTWIEDGKVRYRTATEVLTGLATIPAGTPIRTELKDLTVVVIGQSGAHAWASFSTTIGTQPRGFTFGGMISLVLEKQNDTWRLVGGHTSSPTRQ